MRHIDIECLLWREGWPPDGWEELVEKAKEELRNLSDGKSRAGIFKKYSHVWSKVKDYYRDLSHEKCWYCETKTDRHRGDMDHYRPKGGITGTNHPGYWWLAFEWKNWRFCCEICNSKLADHETGIVGGKGNDFPLVGNDESRRIWSECHYEDLICELPALLDPTEQEDTKLLTFLRDGRPASRTTDECSIEYERVKCSIRAYHLDHSKLNRKRKEIYHQVRELVEEYQRYQPKWEKERDLSARAVAKRAMTKLLRMIAPHAEYSVAARAYLKGYRREGYEWEWIDDILTA
jgi:hypothetical protein